MSEQLAGGERYRLFELISESYSVEEIETLSFRFNIDDEDMPRATKSEFIQELIAYFERQGLIADLLTVLGEERPNVSWPTLGSVKTQEHFPIYYQEPGIVTMPPKFLGRQKLLDKVNKLVEDGCRVLLHGIIGAGKTAVAAKIGDDYLKRGDGGVIWFNIDDLEADPLFNMLAQRLGTPEEQKEIRQVQNEADLVAIQKLLARYRPSLVILDNAANPAAVEAFIKALPNDMPLLVTSQLVMTLPDLKPVSIGDLSEQDALTLFNHYAGRDYSQNNLALELVRALAYHPYSLEIAGAIVKADGRIISRRVNKIAQVPSELELPFGGRPALGALLEESYDALSETAQMIFRAIGALSVSGATPELLALLLGKDIDGIYESLDELVFLSLARNQQIDWIPVKEDDIEHYDFHELTYQYSKVRFQEERGSTTNLIKIMNQFGEQMEWKPAFVRAEICNFIGAAHDAQQQQADEDLITIMTGLTMYGYLDTYGHTNEFVELLDVAIEAVKKQGETAHELLHYLVGKRGNVYIDRGQPAEARKKYEKALELAPNSLRQVMALAVLGKVCYQMKNYPDGDDYFERGHAVLEAEENVVALGFLYQQQSVAKGLAEEYEASRNFAEQAVQINRQFADSNPPRYLFSLLNLGTAEERLGNLDRAVEIHTEGYERALEKGLKRLAADMAYSLAQDLQALGQPEQVMGKLQQAQRLYHEAGEVAYEQSVIEYIRNLG